MPRPHWKNASANVQRTIRAWLGDDRPAAEAWLDAAACAKSFGYVFDEPTLPHLAALEKLQKGRDPLAVAEYRRAYAVNIAAEQRALAWWKPMSTWATTDPKPTKALADEQKRCAAEREQRLQARVDELLALANTGGARVLLPADALDQARRELGHVSP